jgi:hypothetical protein
MRRITVPSDRHRSNNFQEKVAERSTDRTEETMTQMIILIGLLGMQLMDEPWAECRIEQLVGWHGPCLDVVLALIGCDRRSYGRVHVGKS